MTKFFIKSSIIVSLMTFISRILGLVRDIIVANYFGASQNSDAFFVAFKIPNFLRRLFAEGAFSQAFIPILAKTKETKSENEVNILINHIGTKLLTILIIITAIAVLAAPIIIFVFAFGFYQTPKFELASDMLRITFPYLLFISLTAFMGGILNTYNRFAAPAFTPVLLNIAIILSAVFLADYFEKPIMALAWGVFFGGIAQVLFQIPFLMKIKKLPKFVRGTHNEVSVLKKRMLPAIFGVSVSQINLLFDTFLASFLVTGSISWLYYSDRLLEFPLGLFGIALATVALPSLSSQHSKSDFISFKKTLGNSLKLAIILGVPAMIGLILLSEHLLTTLFQYGDFSFTDVKKSSSSLIAYSFGLVGFMFIKILASAFYARGDTKTPVKVGVIAMLSNMVLNLILIFHFKHVGLALATSIAAFINAALLYFYLFKQNIYRFDKSILMIFIKVIMASGLMILFLFLYGNDINSLVIADTFKRSLLLLEDIIIAICIYFSCIFLFKIRFKDL